MQHKSVFLAFLAAIVSLSIVVAAFFDLPFWLIAAQGSVVALLLILSLTGSLRWGASLRHQLSKQFSLTRSVEPWWKANHFQLIEKDHEVIAHKFAAARMVSRLSDSEDALEVANDANDPIAKAIREIRVQMISLKEAENKRAWIAKGLAEFSSILRNRSDLKSYGQLIISNLVRYVGANQGALFVEYSTADGRHMDLMGCYAYEKKKFVESRVNEGEGLLGQCMLEKEFIFITDVPNNYVKITSGLGYATPKNIVIAPLLFNESFYGAIELASFEVLQTHQIQFLKEVCENIASEIASLRTFEHTQSLLTESNKLALELKDREEVMRQNLEELATAQYEMQRKQSELSGLLHAIDSTLGTIEFDLEGRMLRCNAIVETLFGLVERDLRQISVTAIIGNEGDFNWSNVLSGITREGEFSTFTKMGTPLSVHVTFTPMQNTSNKIERVLCMVQDISARKKYA